jgi:hypothetical protein
VVLQQFLCLVYRCIRAISLVRHVLLYFYHPVAKYISLVGNVDGYTHVSSSLSSCHSPAVRIFLLTRFPIGITGFAASFTGPLSRIFSAKWIILTGIFLSMIASILLALGGGQPEDYWMYVFPALVLGSSGVMLTFVHTK